MSKLSWEWNGQNHVLMADGKPVGHFYIDADADDVDAEVILAGMVAPIEIGIVLEGGIVQSVFTNGDRRVEATVIDYDTEGGDLGELLAVRQYEDGQPTEDWIPAYVNDWGRVPKASFDFTRDIQEVEGDVD